MTIKELENKTGMTRANIRFYEGEGLLSPKRMDNGYRDYSEEDARTLEKIKLLRQLQLDIDTIRKVQRGTLTLEQALFTQMTRLEGDRVLIERAAQVCRELERSRVEYAALDPQPWLEQLHPPGRPVLPAPPPAPERDDTPRACCHPWMRFFARALDMTLYETLLNVVWLLVFRNQDFLRLQTGNLFLQWLWALLMLALSLALEPFWLHYWGWTPGKWVFGLKLRDKNGNKLSLSNARWRSWELMGEGYGWNIPFLNLYRMWKNREAGLNGKDSTWDWGLRYTKEYRRFSGPAYVAAEAACMVLIYVAMLWARLPLCQGNLTVEGFARNYEHYQNLLLPGNTTTLGSSGRWVEPEPAAGVVVIDLSGGSTQWDDPEFTLTDGSVTAVTLHMESGDWIVNTGAREALALLAMSGALDGWNLFNFDLKDWARTADETLGQWEDVELDYRGLHISQQVAYEGYTLVNDTLWKEDEYIGTRHCEKVVTISIIP